METLNEKDSKKLYIAAKDAYYTGEPIMSDTEFDRLEEYMEKSGFLDRIVGFMNDDRNAKFEHPSKMLSLAKFQASINGDPPTEQAEVWLTKNNSSVYEATPKFDGNAVNAIYRNNKLYAILSRGDGITGRDYTDKLMNILPNTINSDKDGIIEIRGEVVISTDIFMEKYSKEFKNERNFVAGVLNRDDDVTNITKDFTFIAIDGRISNGYIGLDEINEMGFNTDHAPYVIMFNKDEFIPTYDAMLEYRTKSKFRLDGFVIKTDIETRKSLGENSHDPNWAIAIKFPPEEAVTNIIDIQWNFGKTGRLTPVAIFESTAVDGTIVQRASLHNYGWMIEMGCVPGAKVTIAKKGDIIPQVTKVNSMSTIDYEPPTNCPECEEPLSIINGLHLECVNEECSGIEYYKFAANFNLLKIDGVADALIKKVYKAGFKTILDVLDKSKFTKEALIESGEFVSGLTLNNLVDQVNSINTVTLQDVIRFMQINGLGTTLSKQIANKVAGIDYSFKSMQKDLCTDWDVGQVRHTELMNIINSINDLGIEVKYPKEDIIQNDAIKFELTGSPKKFGFNTKKEFIDYAKTKGYVHTKMKDADILITDDMNSSSSKMKTALNKGMDIKLYSDV